MAAKDGGFLQSKCWACFQQKLGRKTIYIARGAFKFLAVKQNLPLNLNYFLIPRGPIFKKNPTETTTALSFLQSVLRVAQKEKIPWIKFEPQKSSDLKTIKKALQLYNQQQGTDYFIKKSTKEHQPRQTVFVNLQQKNLLSTFKSKTRYNIRLSQRKGVQVFKARQQKDIDQFLKLLQETARRNQIKNHPSAYYRTMIETGTKGCRDKKDGEACRDKIQLYLARKQNDILAGAIVSFSDPVATYLHGASSSRKRNLMAPFALHWQIIRDAQRKGYRHYDLGGVKAFYSRNKLQPEQGSWFGLTRFKLGFCPQGPLIEFPGGYDLVLNKTKYNFYRLAQSLKNKFPF